METKRRRKQSSLAQPNFCDSDQDDCTGLLRTVWLHPYGKYIEEQDILGWISAEKDLKNKVTNDEYKKII